MNCACFAGAATMQVLSGAAVRAAESAGAEVAHSALFALLAGTLGLPLIA